MASGYSIKWTSFTKQLGLTLQLVDYLARSLFSLLKTLFAEHSLAYSRLAVGDEGDEMVWYFGYFYRSAFNDATHWMLSIGREVARLFRRHELATELQQVLSSVRNANLQLTS